MKEINLHDLEQVIEKNKDHAERALLRRKPLKRQMRNRPRDPDESIILDKLCVLKWKRALETGKVVILSQREWYYEPD